MLNSLLFLNRYVLDMLMYAGFVLSLMVLIRAILYKNCIRLRVIKFALVAMAVASHIILKFRAFLPGDVANAVMLMEALAFATYIATNSITAFIVMRDYSGRHHNHNHY